MKITVSSLYFHPDHSGIAVYASEFVEHATEQGHQVNVVTGFPFYPDWQKRKSDRRRLFRKDSALGATVYRGYVYVPRTVTAVKRIANELSFLLFASVNFLRAGKPDAIVVFTTPVLLGVMARVLGWLWRCPVLINVQDFQIEAARSLGMLEQSPVLKAMEALERWSYRGKRVVTSSISPRMLALLGDKDVRKAQQLLWPNWVKVSDYQGAAEPGLFRQQQGIDATTKLMVYAGNIGEKQGLEVLVDLAEHYQQQSDLQFLIVGAGAALPRLKAYAEKKALPNLKFLPFMKPPQYKALLADADMVFLSQQKTESDIYFPSKLLGLMASGKLLCVAADAESELYKVIRQERLGYTSEIADQQALQQNVQAWLEGAADSADYVANAQRWVMQFDRQPVLDSVLEQLQKMRDQRV